MSRSDDVPADMTASRRALDDAAAERLLSGRTADGTPELAAMVTALRRLQEPPPSPSAGLAALLAEGFDPAELPAPSADAPRSSPVRSRRGPLRHPVATVAGLSLLAKVLLGGGVAVAGVSSAAGVGALPGPVQDRVAVVIEAVTPFHLPRSNAAQPDSPPPSTVPSPTATAVPPAPDPQPAPSLTPAPPRQVTPPPTPEPTVQPAPAPPTLVPDLPAPSQQAPPTAQPTEPSAEPTEPSAEPTEPSAEPSEPALGQAPAVPPADPAPQAAPLPGSGEHSPPSQDPETSGTSDPPAAESDLTTRR